MAWRDKPIEKIYFSIHEVATEVGVAPSTLRVWEKWFGLTIQKKSRHGYDRSYTKNDVALLKEIHRLLKIEMYTVKGAIRQLELHNKVSSIKEDTKAFFLDNELRPTSEYSQEAPPV